MVRSGTVIRGSSDHLEIAIEPDAGCDTCEMKASCGTSLLGRVLGHRYRSLIAPTALQAKPGERVQVVIAEQPLLAVALLVYGLPLLGFLIGAGLLQALGTSEGWVVLAALVGLLAGAAATRCLLSTQRAIRAFSPRIQRVLDIQRQ